MIFTHIPKTAGTAVRQTLFYPNVPVVERCECHGLRQAVSQDWRGCYWLEGHHPYGIHRLLRGWNDSTIYLTLLRRPLEQAISFYHFVLQSKTSTYEHPGYVDAARLTIGEFYQLPKYQNMQTRFIAGLAWYRMRSTLLRTSWQAAMLRRATRNLFDRFDGVGIVEEIDESVAAFAEFLGWPVQLPVPRVKKTGNRPAIGELAASDLQLVRRGLSADLALYERAQSVIRREGIIRRRNRGSAGYADSITPER